VAHAYTLKGNIDVREKNEPSPGGGAPPSKGKGLERKGQLAAAGDIGSDRCKRQSWANDSNLWIAKKKKTDWGVD